MNVAQGELGEAREDASGRDGDAEAAEVEGDSGGVLEAWEVKDAFLPAVSCVLLLRYQIGEGMENFIGEKTKNLIIAFLG
jgi:hypothetical protein